MRLTCLGYKDHLHLGLKFNAYSKILLDVFFIFIFLVFSLFSLFAELPKTSGMNRRTLMHSVQDHFKDASEAMVAMSEHRRFVQV